jgi:hypothetical protein
MLGQKISTSRSKYTPSSELETYNIVSQQIIVLIALFVHERCSESALLLVPAIADTCLGAALACLLPHSRQTEAEKGKKNKVSGDRYNRQSDGPAGAIPFMNKHEQTQWFSIRMIRIVREVTGNSEGQCTQAGME